MRNVLSFSFEYTGIKGKWKKADQEYIFLGLSRRIDNNLQVNEVMIGHF